ncbi:outer membrane lipoprotein carrier protein LolA [Ulvibacter litoralis]|uniref:Outer membrane lipoprotein carrier protein n=1 Tax=Ulvibacter litoralis TaxID=227084 RepID=A0A1G7DTA9_9FLAO|nr:outer membrane lipoprotein carrier protein LolA [Ulvibacter litoralis]GHC42375.1 cell envelope biogenesis protein LolA [Ulvibacter litoralis]SDE54759.1 outer membrane lipoprotein carrier protein [Ulvibacter litoralis]
MRKYLFILVLVCSSVLFGQEVTMNASEIIAFKKQVQTTASATKTITSDFVQYKHLDFLDNDIETSGKLVFKSPDLVKWEYTNPYQYTVVFKEDQLLINDGGTKSNVDIGSSKLFKKLSELIVNSVKGTLFDTADFDVSYLKTNGENKVIFTPKDKKMAGYIASFELLFTKEDATVTEVKMVEPSEDFTRIVFTNRIVNSNVNDAVFTN